MPVLVEGRRIENARRFNPVEGQIIGAPHSNRSPETIIYQLNQQTKITKEALGAWWDQPPICITYNHVTGSNHDTDEKPPVFNAVKIEAVKGQEEYHQTKRISISEAVKLNSF